MNSKIFTLLILILISVTAFAQKESRKDSILINWSNKFQEQSKPLTIENEWKSEATNETKEIDAEELKRREQFIKSLQFEIPKLYKGPKEEEEELGRVLPHTNDYAFGDETPLNNNFSITTSSSHTTYQTIGASRMININLNYEINEWLSASGGVYGAKYNMVGFNPDMGATINHYNDLGFDASLRFKLHDRVHLRTFGRYSINNNSKDRLYSPVHSGMFPRTHYGGAVEFKINDNFGVEAGMVREFNPMIRKWENIPFLAPIFYSNGRRR